ncbi:hypothetical protein [Starkeya nomas]|uniref:hypothetical protein n=1 Tax=Starkeya nomas TaxID=2666134 RepID=UPI001FCECB36|nr:hypothetical protein [Starkeya nomas]
MKEDPSVELRVGGTPDTVRRYIGLGAEVVVASGAGLASGIGDGEYEGAGASVVGDGAAAVKDADVVLAVRRPSAAALKGAKPGALVIAIRHSATWRRSSSQ